MPLFNYNIYYILQRPRLSNHCLQFLQYTYHFKEHVYRTSTGKAVSRKQEKMFEASDGYYRLDKYSMFPLDNTTNVC